MKRLNAYFRQLVSEANVDEWFDEVELADQRMMSDLGLYGIMSGLTVVQSSPTGLTSDVVAGTAYDQAGQRLRVPSLQTVDLTEDYLGSPTEVTLTGQGKWLSLYLTFDRDLTNPKTDGNGDTVMYDRAESFAFKVVQGSQSLTPTRPALLTDAILLSDIALSYGQTAITSLHIDTTRTMKLFRQGGAPIAMSTTSIGSAIDTLLDGLNDHLTGTANKHGAADVEYNGSGKFADGTTDIDVDDLEAALDQFVTFIAGTVSPSGDDILGVRQDATQSPTLSNGTLRTRLTDLRLLSNLVYGGSPNWADGTSISAGPGEAAIDGIVTALTSTSGNRGAGKLTGPAASGSPDSLSADTIAAQLAALLAAVNLRARKGSTETITGAWTFDQTIAYSSGSVVRAQTSPLYNATTGVWSPDGALSMAASDLAEQVLSELADGSTLTAVTAYINPSNDSNMPGTKPTLEVKRRDVTTGTLTTLGVATVDATADGAAYEAHHGFSVTGLSEAIDRTKYRYYVLLTGEQGLNAASISFAGCTATMTVTSQAKVA